MENNNLNQRKKYNTPLIIVSCVIVFAFVAFTAIRPEASLNGVNTVFDGIIKYFGAILETFTFGAVVVSLYFCFSNKYANVRFGHDEPEYSMFSYCAMMFLAAVASALLYWSFTEWAFYYQTPGIGLEPKSTAALEAGLGYSFFHWGIHGQAIYVVIALAIAYAFYIRKVPSLQTSAVCQAMMGNKVNPKAKGIIGNLIDFCVIFGILGGLGVSLGLSVPLTAGALHQVFGIKVTFLVQVIVIVGIAAVFTFTSFIGTQKGMKRISNMSVILCGAFLGWIFFVGPTDFIMKNTANSFGWMLEMMPRASLFTDPIADTGFPEAWTLFFQAFYLNYAAMMGIFIAKISKGRTVRQLSIATLFGISIGGWVVFAVDSSYAIYTQKTGLTDVVELINSYVGEAGIYQIIETLPLGKVVLPLLLIFVIVGFVASSLDSASLSLSQTTQRIMNEDGNVNPLLRVFWCVILTLVPLSIMFIGANFSTLKTLAIIVSIPFMFIVAFMGIRLFMWLAEDDRNGVLDRYRVVKKKADPDKVVEYKPEDYEF